MRRLQVTVAGRWYLALTILLGVVALTSGNNVIYLIESLLLSGMILSGILSEKTVSGVRISFQRSPAFAETPCSDYFIVTNTTSMPLYCLEIGEWVNGEFDRRAFIAEIPAHEKATVRSTRTFPKRGVYRWDGIAIGTSYPFGFACKIKLLDDEAGERVVWPARFEGRQLRDATEHSGRRPGISVAEGEIRAMVPDDDYRSIVWTLSSKGTEPLVRQRRSQDPPAESSIDTRVDEGAEFERRIKSAANIFYAASAVSEGGNLIVLDWKGKRRVFGKISALNELATLEPSGDIPA